VNEAAFEQWLQKVLKVFRRADMHRVEKLVARCDDGSLACIEVVQCAG
jgi:hypothetical protein